MLNKKHWLAIAGFGISLVFLFLIFSRIDWIVFLDTLERIYVPWLFIALAFTAIAIMGRALRWNLITGLKINHYPYFWRAASIGYLGNIIYPVRTGEILRIYTISRSAKIPMGQAISSVIVDRIADGISMGLFMLLVIAQNSINVPGGKAVTCVIGLFAVSTILVVVFVHWGDKGRNLIMGLGDSRFYRLKQKLLLWYNQAFEGMQVLRNKKRIVVIGFLGMFIFIIDSIVVWFIIMAFGWQLPFFAAITLAVFIEAGSSLPSAPGYIGIFQIACVLALKIYSVDESSAVAFSVVFQLLTFTLIFFQGILAAIQNSFGILSAMRVVSRKVPTE